MFALLLSLWVSLHPAGSLCPLFPPTLELTSPVQSWSRGVTLHACILEKYICVFVRMTTKATYLEIIEDLSSEGFLAALHCFIAHQVWLDILATDNGTNFKEALKELQDLDDLLRAPKTQNVMNGVLHCYISSGHIHLPWSPHFGKMIFMVLLPYVAIWILAIM